MNISRIISVVELKALLYLYNHSKKIKVTSLSRKIDVVYSNLYKNIFSLEDKGLLKRIKNMKDKRGYEILLTPKGKVVTELILKIKRLCN